MKGYKELVARAADLILAPFVFPAALLLKLVRRAGISRLPFSRKVLLAVGVFPIRNHYYEPLFDHRDLRQPLDKDRVLPGINWNVAEQLELLADFRFTSELSEAANTSDPDLRFHISNGMFEGEDAAYYYNLIRLKKPARIIEIGSGVSTLIAVAAIKMNTLKDSAYSCDLRCVEPFEAPWLEKTGAKVEREKAERLGTAYFADLDRNDILFIDSSHIIRPQGDVLFEYLQLLPSLADGVIVHIHDIFSPKDYPEKWIVDEVYFWNEQYLLEALLTNNREWKVIGALNHLHHHHRQALSEKCFMSPNGREPRSFYIQKTA